VVAIDIDAPVLDRARAQFPDGAIARSLLHVGCTRLLDPNRWPLPAHPAPLAAPHGAHGSDDGKEEGSDQRISLYTTAMPDCRCCYAGQAASHRNCPPDEGELPKAAAI
jgi:hypothetical protein